MTVVREHRFPKLMATTIASSTRNAVAAGAHTLENSVREKPSKGAETTGKSAFLAPNRYYSTFAEVIAVPTDGHRVPSHVQKVLAGKLRLVGNEGESCLGLGPHQAFDRIGGARTVVGQQHHAQHGALGRKTMGDDGQRPLAYLL